MDPITAFTLAASVLQVVAFGAEVVRTGKQIYESGSTVGHIELEKTAADIEAATKNLKDGLIQSCTGSSPLSKEDQVSSHLTPQLRRRPAEAVKGPPTLCASPV